MSMDLICEQGWGFNGYALKNVTDEAKISFVEEKGVYLLKKQGLYDEFKNASQEEKLKIIENDLEGYNDFCGFIAVLAQIIGDDLFSLNENGFGTGIQVIYGYDEDKNSQSVLLPVGMPWQFNEDERNTLTSIDAAQAVFQPYLDMLGVSNAKIDFAQSYFFG